MKLHKVQGEGKTWLTTTPVPICELVAANLLILPVLAWLRLGPGQALAAMLLWIGGSCGRGKKGHE